MPHASTSFLILAQSEDGSAPPAPPAPPALPDDAISSVSTPAGSDTTNPSATGESSTPLGPNGAPTTAPPPTDFSFLFIMIAVMAIFYIFVIRSQRKQKKERETMLTSIQKGARVSTVGGIIGTVVDVKEDEIVLKVDEGNNTKIHFSRSAVQSVIEKD